MVAGRTPLALEIETVRWPLIKPFRITGYRFDASSTIVATITDGVHRGRGEASGVYYRGETAEQMIDTIEAVRAQVEAGLSREELRTLLPAGGARNAIDCALWDLDAARASRPVWCEAGLASVKPLLTTWTIGVDTPEAMASIARGYRGIRAIKLKLVGDVLDANRVRAVRTVRPDVWLGVDANQGFTSESLRDLLPTLSACKVDLIEQPFPVGADDMLLGRQWEIPVAADESLQTIADLDRLAPFYDVINIKLDKCGGLTEGLMLARRARELGLKVMVGNMTGTSLGMAPALIVGQMCDIVDLDGPIFLTRDYSPGVSYADGRIGIDAPFWGGYSTSIG